MFRFGHDELRHFDDPQAIMRRFIQDLSAALESAAATDLGIS